MPVIYTSGIQIGAYANYILVIVAHVDAVVSSYIQSWS